MIRKLKLTLGSLFCAVYLVGSTFSVSASEYSQFVDSLVYLKDLSTENSGLYFSDLNGYTYIVDAEGNICYDYSYDENGDLYYTEEGSVTGILKSASNADGIYFDENGKYVNPSMVDPERYKQLSIQFETDQFVTLNNQDDILNFLEYYSLQYRLYDEVETLYITKNSDGTYTINLPDNKIYNRQETLDLIHATFTPLEGNTPYEKIFNLCQKIRYESTYDLEYKHSDLKTVLTDKRGVCWQYAAIGKVLLEDAGIQTEIMHGTLNGENHMWLRCLVDGKWCYVDPTATQTGWWDYSNLPYDKFLSSYVPKRYVSYINN